MPPLPTYISTLLCIDLVLPMGWVNSPDMFCAASNTVADVANCYLLDPTSAFTVYPPTAGTYYLAPYPTASAARIQYVDVYMDDLNCATQGYVGQQQRVSELTIRSKKEIFPSLLAEVKDSVSLKNSMQDNCDWDRVKEILGCIISTHYSTLRLPPKRLAELKILLVIPSSQRRMSTKKLDRLIEKFQSIHLAIPGDVGIFTTFRWLSRPLTMLAGTQPILSKQFTGT